VEIIVLSRFEVSKPPGLTRLPPVSLYHRLGLDIAFDLLPKHRIALHHVELDRSASGCESRGCVSRSKRKGVEVGRPPDLEGIHQKKELAFDVVGIVEDKGILVNQSRLGSNSPESKLARPPRTLLLREDGLELDPSDLTRHQDAEVSDRDPTSQESRLGKGKRDVTELHALEDLSRLSLIVELELVRSGEFAGLVVIDVDEDPICDRPLRQEVELDLRLKLGNESGAAGELEGGVAWAEQGPVSTKFSPRTEPDGQIRKW
jgi:hypothetical protein